MAFIRLEKVCKVIHGHHLLTSVSISIQKADIMALVGINGSGKKLILKAILGLMRVSGKVIVKDTMVNVSDRYPLRAGVLIERPGILDSFSAYQNLKLVADLMDNVGDQDILKILLRLGLPTDKRTKVRNFSLGMKQKLGIAQAMLGHNELIVLDEPTNALDEDSVNKLIGYIKDVNKQGATFIITSHDATFIDRIATRRIKVEAGRVE